MSAVNTGNGIDYGDYVQGGLRVDLYDNGNLYQQVSENGWVLVYESDENALARIQSLIDNPEAEEYGDTTLIDRYNAGEVL